MSVGRRSLPLVGLQGTANNAARGLAGHPIKHQASLARSTRCAGPNDLSRVGCRSPVSEEARPASMRRTLPTVGLTWLTHKLQAAHEA